MENAYEHLQNSSQNTVNLTDLQCIWRSNKNKIHHHPNIIKQYQHNLNFQDILIITISILLLKLWIALRYCCKLQLLL